jgi:hypothetical protein
VLQLLRGETYFEIVGWSDSHLSTNCAAASISASFYKLVLKQAKITIEEQGKFDECLTVHRS